PPAAIASAMGATRRPAPASTGDTLCSPSERIKFLRRCRCHLSRLRTSARPNARDVDVTEAGGIAPNPLYWPGELERTGHGPLEHHRHDGGRRAMPYGLLAAASSPSSSRESHDGGSSRHARAASQCPEREVRSVRILSS